MQRVADIKNKIRIAAREVKWTIGNSVKNMDVFGQEVPSFSLKGKSKITSLFGGVITLLIITLTLGYAGLKGI